MYKCPGCGRTVTPYVQNSVFGEPVAQWLRIHIADFPYHIDLTEVEITASGATINGLIDAGISEATQSETFGKQFVIYRCGPTEQECCQRIIIYTGILDSVNISITQKGLSFSAYSEHLPDKLRRLTVRDE